MRLATVRVDAETTRAAVVDADSWVLLEAGDVGALIARDGWREEIATALRTGADRVAVADAELVRPLLAPSKIFCCGLNYRDHIVETGRDVPTHPTLFAKFADTLADPTADIVVRGSSKVDWEAELAVVVGTMLRDADRDEAAAGILGYTVANDVSMRDWQSRTLQWLQGKAWDASTPIGPTIVTADALEPRDGLRIECLVDDEVVQSSSTAELVFDAAELVSYISGFTTLRPGDIVLTGTPGGVGMGRSPQRWIADGETVTTRIEGIGELRNRFTVTPGDDR